MAGTRIPFSIDLGLSSQGATSLDPVVLQVWGAANSCGKDELLWTSPPVTNVDEWRAYCGTLSPKASHAHLTLVPVGVGYLMMDNLGARLQCDTL